MFVFHSDRSKALALPNTRTSCASSKSRFRRLFAILNQKRLMALKCNCVTVRHDFDNVSAGRREVLFPSFPDPVRKPLNSMLRAAQEHLPASCVYMFGVVGSERALTFRSGSTVDIASRQSICQRERFLAIRRTGGVSVHGIRDAAIPLNPWQQNNHPIAIAIAMEHQLLICAGWPQGLPT